MNGYDGTVSCHPPGTILSRRKILTLFGAVGTGLFAVGLSRRGLLQSQPNQPASLPACIVRPVQTEGPYFIDDQLNRSDIRFDTTDRLVNGAPLQLTLHVSQLQSNACIPASEAIVDIWHCDAQGIYSDVADPNFSTIGQHFLRGYQVTDSNGIVQFTTIYPGWYPGRTSHIHFKVRLNRSTGQNYEFTSQLYFDDSITDRIYTQAAYANRGGRRVRNAEDRIFRDGGDQLLLTITETEQGYAARFDLGLQIS